MKKNKVKSLFVLVVLLFLNVSVSYGAQINGILFSDTFEDEGIVLSLQGVGRKWVLFMKVFAAGFYLDEGISSNDPLQDVAKRIEVSYYHPIPAKKLAKYTRDRMKINMTKEEYRRVEDRVDMMDGYFVDLKPGDHYSLTYIPSIGTKFAYNGDVVGVIEGADFAKGLFAVWVGTKPFDKNLKLQILGKDKMEKADVSEQETGYEI